MKNPVREANGAPGLTKLPAPSRATLHLKRLQITIVPGLSIAATGATNLLMALTVQKAGGLDNLAIYALVTIPYVVALAIQRLVLSQSVSRGLLVSAVAGLKPFCIALTTLATVASMLTAIVAGLNLWAILISLMVPVAITQDLLRTLCFGQKKPQIALLSDGTWLLGVLGAFVAVLLASPGAISLSHIAAVMLVSASAGLGVACLQMFRLRLQSANFETARLRPLVVESVAVFGAGQITQYVAAVFLSLQVLGEYRSVLLLFTPVTLLSNLTQAVALPRLRIEDRRSVNRVAWALASLCAAAGVVTTIIGYLDPFSVPSQLGFITGAQIIPTCLLLIVAVAVSGYLTIALVRFRVVKPHRVWLNIRVTSAFLDPIVSIPTALLTGAPGIATGTVASNVSTLSAKMFVDVIDARKERSF